jgi:hypothetical protein
MTNGLESVLVSILSARKVEAWVQSAQPSDVDGFCAAYTAAARKVGRALLTESEKNTLQTTAPAVVFDRWTVADAARILLLLSAARALDADAFPAFATACLERGDAREQESWMRGVSMLPSPERFLPQVIEGCRTNVIPLFEAIACDNPYPASHFPDRHFNQMVLKALFNGIPIARVVGLRQRVNAELSRMAADYAAERRAAGRPVPADIGLAS